MVDASEARPSSSCCRCPCRRCHRSRGKLPWLRCSRCVRRTLARIMRFFEDVEILQLFGRRDAGALADPFTATRGRVSQPAAGAMPVLKIVEEVCRRMDLRTSFGAFRGRVEQSIADQTASLQGTATSLCVAIRIDAGFKAIPRAYSESECRTRTFGSNKRFELKRRRDRLQSGALTYCSPTAYRRMPLDHGSRAYANNYREETNP